LTHPLDLRVDGDLKALAERVGAVHGKLDILVHNAYSGQPGTVENASADDFRNAFDVTVTAAFRLVQQMQPALRRAAEGEGPGASVINIASMYGIVSPDPRIYGDSGSNNPPYYGSAKAGLIQLTRYLACHLAGAGIRVNSISPGPFPPPEIAQTAPGFHAELCRKVPLGRIGRPDELIGALLFLASGASSYITGANLVVDGGWTAW
jgi:NAD(P)-dependent dehydrogenase (short-subunit alcohol dehydrogenase family)